MSSTGQTLFNCRLEERDIILCLIEAVKVIRQWHGRGLFDTYYNHSPEMRTIREKLESYGVNFLRDFRH